MMEVTLNVPMGEQAHLKEMFSMLEENHMEAQAQNLEDFLQYFNQMEQYFGDMQSELLYLREQLDQLNDKTLKSKMENLVKIAGDRADSAKLWFGALKNDVSAGVKNAVVSAKYYGGQALNTVIDKTKVDRALTIINEHLQHSAENLEHSAKTMGDIGFELSVAKDHKKNARNLLMGKETTDIFEYDYDKGFIAKIRQAIEFCGKILKNMLGHTEKLQKSLDNFNQKSMESKAERNKNISASVKNTDMNRNGKARK